MTNEEAIKTAIEFEKRVTAVYEQAAAAAGDDAGKKVFGALAEEEKGHVAYLEHKLKQLADTGAFTAEPLQTVVPAIEIINEGIGKMEKRVAPRDRSQELEFLRQALVAEQETSEFYERMVNDLDEAGKELFRHFLAIEQGHQIIVQAEIDALTGAGFWVDFQEFNLEAG
jgi:rubrerythrin